VVTNLNADLLDSQSGAFYQNATNTNAGTLADARLSSNIPRLNTSNIFTAPANRFSEVNVDSAETNDGTFTGGLLRLGGTGSGEGIASNRTSDINGNRYGIDFYTNGGTRQMSLTVNGDLGIGEAAPAGRVQVRGGSGAIMELNTLRAGGESGAGGLFTDPSFNWQSWKPWTDGAVTQVDVTYKCAYLPPFASSWTTDVTARLYQGEGTAGPVLGAVTISNHTFVVPNLYAFQFVFSPAVPVVADQTYTIALSSSNVAPSGAIIAWLGSFDNPDPRGQSDYAFANPGSNQSLNDLCMAVHTTVSGRQAFFMSQGGDVGIGTITPQMRLDVAGGILCDHLFDRSSAALKTDIRPLSESSALIAALAPSRYRLKDPARGGEDIGLIAEQVDKVLPELVAHNPDGSAIGVKYDRLSVLAIGALQDQAATLRRLEAENKSLRERLDRLEQLLSTQPPKP